MHRYLAALLLLLAACATYQPPAPAEPREATPVNASMGQTWDAVIDLFASRNIPIRTIERVSGIITTEGLRVNPDDAVQWADCGVMGHVQYRPNMAIYNVLVRGDSSSSSVRATVRWTYWTHDDGDVECTSRYVYERDLEHLVKLRAQEAQRTASRHSDPPVDQPEDPPAPLVPSSPTMTYVMPRTPTTVSGSGAAALPEKLSPPIRTNEQLLRSSSFRLAVGDAQRTRVIAGFREQRPDTLTVDLGEGAFTSASAQYNLSRLYVAYRGTTDYSTQGALELQQEGRRIGLYTQNGLRWMR